jgi:hypothetical protein
MDCCLRSQGDLGLSPLFGRDFGQPNDAFVGTRLGCPSISMLVVIVMVWVGHL